MIVNTFKQNRYYFSLANSFPGLARGPIDHNASSVINSIANGSIQMGSAIVLSSSIPTAELLARVEESTSGAITDLNYGIVVGGDTDGIYGDGTANTGTDISNVAAESAGQGVVVVTQGRCLARVDASTTINIGDGLGASTTPGVLEKADGITQFIIARALQPVTSTPDTLNIIAVDVQRENLFSV